eukprot:scaffold42482_cov39-Tisochrysis_lutea.AAC.2
MAAWGGSQIMLGGRTQRLGVSQCRRGLPRDEQSVDIERIDNEIGVELHNLINVNQGKDEGLLRATGILEDSGLKDTQRRR